MTTPLARREAALKAVPDHELSQRRAFPLFGVDPKTVRRECLPDHPEIRHEMGEIAKRRRRFGYRRIGIMLERKGMVMNHKKLYRLYREEGLAVRRRRGRKRAHPESPCAARASLAVTISASLGSVRPRETCRPSV